MQLNIEFFISVYQNVDAQIHFSYICDAVLHVNFIWRSSTSSADAPYRFVMSNCQKCVLVVSFHKFLAYEMVFAA